jgi:hypothetical protein
MVLVRYMDYQRIVAGWIGTVACMGEKRLLNGILNTWRKCGIQKAYVNFGGLY